MPPPSSRESFRRRAIRRTPAVPRGARSRGPRPTGAPGPWRRRPAWARPYRHLLDIVKYLADSLTNVGNALLLRLVQLPDDASAVAPGSTRIEALGTLLRLPARRAGHSRDPRGVLRA